MYTIKRAAERAGVPVASLRAWERRYGVVHPARTGSGYRLYDETAIGRLRTMRRLISEGWSASAAASAVLSGVADAASTADRAPVDHATDLTVAAADSGRLAGDLVAAAAALDSARVGAVLDEMFVRGRFELVVGQLLLPALRGLGDAWADNRVGIAGEHLVSAAVLRRLAAFYDAAGTDRSVGGSVVVGLPPDSQHEIGALAFAVVARRRGMPVTYLGPNLPIDDWVASCVDAAAAVIGIVTDHDRVSGLQVASAIKEARPGVILALGGKAARSGDGYLVLPQPLDDAVERLRAALGAARA